MAVPKLRLRGLAAFLLAVPLLWACSSGPEQKSNPDGLVRSDQGNVQDLYSRRAAFIDNVQSRLQRLQGRACQLRAQQLTESDPDRFQRTSDELASLENKLQDARHTLVEMRRANQQNWAQYPPSIRQKMADIQQGMRKITAE